MLTENEKRLLPYIYLGRKLKKLYEKICMRASAKYRLTQSEADVLLFLANNQGLNTAMDIVRYRLISKSLVSKSVESLSGRGYLETRVDTHDRRYTRLYTTVQALPAILELQKAQADFFDILKAETSPEERRVIMDVFNRLSCKIDNYLSKGETI